MKIHTNQDLSHVSISLWKEETLQSLTKKSGILAENNEYQFHYWAIVLRRTETDGSILDISIPTVIFNYPQTVSGASIEFNLKDVEKYSTQLTSIHNIEVNKLQSLIDFSEYSEVISTPLNSIHRHPGGRNQAFSGTDLDTSLKNPGIVFPLAESSEHRSNVACIISHSNGRTFLAHTEARLVSGDTSSIKGITYNRTRSASYIKAPITGVSKVEEMFGYVPADLSYFNYKDLENIPKHLYEFWDNMDYLPNVEFIEEKHLTQKLFPKTYPNYNYKYKGYPEKPNPEDLYKMAIRALEEEENLYLIDAGKLEVMDTKYFLDYYNELFSYYYGGDFFLEEDSYIPSLEDILELQDMIVDEYIEEIEVKNSYQKTTLILN